MIPRHKRTKLVSCVIVRHSSKGFVAHIRYENEKYNRSVAHQYKSMIYHMVEQDIAQKVRDIYE